MKITAVKPFVVSDGGRNFTLVKIEIDEGLYGVGEAGLSLRGPAVCEVVRAFELDEAALEAHPPMAPKQGVGYRRDDGAYTNW